MNSLTSKPNPWTIKSSEDGFENPWIKLTHFKVLNPSGNAANYTTIHFKNVSVGVIPLDKNLNTYLVGQYRFPLNRYSWEIPEGGSDQNESPLDTAKRELKEEAGITANKWKLLQEFDISNSITDEQAFLYVAQDLSFGEANPDDDEQLELKKMPFEELYRLVESGEIRDSLTVVATLKIKNLLLQNKL